MPSDPGSGPDTAPSKLLTIIGDQPFGQDATGKPVYPSMYFTQVMQRLISLIGQPVEGSASAGIPISAQLGALEAAILNVGQSPGAASPGLTGRVAALEAMVRTIGARVGPPPPSTAGPGARTPDVRPLPPVPAVFHPSPILPPLALANLLDVRTVNPSDGQVLVWNATDQRWENDQRVIGASAAPGSGLFGQSVNIVGGDGDGISDGGGVTLQSGNGGTGGGAPGDVDIFAADGIVSSTLGGNVNIVAGEGGGAGTPGGVVSISAGDGDSATGGFVELIGGNGTGTGQEGGGVFIAMGSASDPTAEPGLLFVNNDESIMLATLSWLAGDALDGRTIFTATRNLQVTAVIARIDAANALAATAAPFKAASGTAFSAGTALTTTSVDLTGAPNTNQTLTLSLTVTDIQLAPGDSIGLVETGTLGTSAGCITIHLAPF